MTKYNTGNPVGSSDPRDLHDNATVADRLVNGGADFYADRLGVNRRSWASVQGEAEAFFESSGYEFVGDYAAGIELTRYSQIVRDTNGEFWRVSGSTALPYTTTGAGLPEGGAFVAVGDAALRQDLGGSPADGQGASLVNGAVIYVGSVADLLDIADPVDGQAFEVTSFHPGWTTASTPPTGGGPFLWDAGRPKADHNGGTVLDPDKVFPDDWSVSGDVGAWYSSGGAGHGVFVRRLDEGVGLDDFGVRRNNAAEGTMAANVIGIGAAIKYCQKTGFVLNISDGDWYFNDSIVITQDDPDKEGLIIKGAGKSNRRLGEAGTTLIIRSAEGKTLLDFQGEPSGPLQGASLSGFTIRGQLAGEHTGVSFNRTYYSDISDISLRYLDTGVYLVNSYGTKLSRMFTSHCHVGVHLDGSSGATSITKSNLRWCFNKADSAAILMTGGGLAVSVDDVNVEGSPYGIRINTAGSSPGDSVGYKGVKLTNIYGEVNNEAVVWANFVTGLTLDNITNQTAARGIELYDCDGVTLGTFLSNAQSVPILENCTDVQFTGSYFNFLRAEAYPKSESSRINTTNYNLVPDGSFRFASQHRNYPFGVTQKSSTSIARLGEFVNNAESFEPGKPVWKVSNPSLTNVKYFWEVEVPENYTLRQFFLSIIVKTDNDNIAYFIEEFDGTSWAATTRFAGSIGDYAEIGGRFELAATTQRVRFGVQSRVAPFTFWVDRVAASFAGFGVREHPRSSVLGMSGRVTLSAGEAEIPFIGFSGFNAFDDKVNLTPLGNAVVWWEPSANGFAIKGTADIEVDYQIIPGNVSLPIEL